MSLSSEVTFLPSWPVLRVHGPDAATWLNGIVTADVSAVRPGAPVWGMLLTKQGKIEAEFLAFGTPEELFLAVCGGDGGSALGTLSRYLVMEDAEIELAAGLGVVGAAGEAAVRALLAAERLAAELPWFSERLAVALTSEPEVVAREVIAASGAVRASGDEAALRIRWGWPVYGRDYSAKDNPHDASLERRAISWTKGCYLGQEVVCMQDMRGKVKRRLIRLRGELPSALEAGAPVANAEGSEVGHVTSVGTGEVFAQVVAPHFELSGLVVGGAPVAVQALTSSPSV